MRITTVVPCYNEAESLPYFYKEICQVARSLEHVEFEYLFINDGSTDETLSIIKKLAVKDKKIKFISFSRNFGKEAAIYAGLQAASGDLVAIMDADLQDPPSLLPEMYRYIVEEHYDSVATRRTTRKGEPPIRSFFAKCFYNLMKRISKVEMMDGARDFRLMTRPFVDAILSMGEYNRFSKGLYGWVGFNTKWIEFENVERVAGATKWSFWKLFKYSLEGIEAFSTAPLSIASLLGMIMSFIGFVSILFIVFRQLLFGGSAYGWPSMACIVILIGGIQLLCTGILGSYISKMYLEVKKRPLYISKETNITSNVANSVHKYHSLEQKKRHANTRRTPHSSI